MTVKVITDSRANLPAAMVKALGISVVPVYVNLRGRSYRDGIDITLDDVISINLTGRIPPLIENGQGQKIFESPSFQVPGLNSVLIPV